MPILDQHEAFHRENEIHRVEGLAPGIGSGIIVSERALNVSICDQRLVRHLGEALQDIRMGDAVELETDIAVGGSRSSRRWGRSTGGGRGFGSRWRCGRRGYG